MSLIKSVPWRIVYCGMKIRNVLLAESPVMLTVCFSDVDVSCFLLTLLMEYNIPQRERAGKTSPFHFPPEKLHNNLPVATRTKLSILHGRPQTPSWADIKVLQRAARFCSAVHVWQLASQTIFERVKHYSAAGTSIIASHLQHFPHGERPAWAMKPPGAFRPLQCLPSITFTSFSPSPGRVVCFG